MPPGQIHQLRTSRGLIAALAPVTDRPAPTLTRYGLDVSDYSNRDEQHEQQRAYLTRILISPSFAGDFITGAILPTQMATGRLLDMDPAEYLWERKGIVTLIPLTQELQPQDQGVRLAALASDLNAQLEVAVRLGAAGVSVRSVIDRADPIGITNVVAQQFAVARQIAAAGLVPLCQPEMRAGSDDRAHAEQLLTQSLLTFLDDWDADVSPLLGLSLPTVDGCYADLVTHEHVLRVLACADEEPRRDATARLTANPGLVACFAGPLVEDLRVGQDDAQFDEALAASVAAIWSASAEGPHDQEP